MIEAIQKFPSANHFCDVGFLVRDLLLLLLLLLLLQIMR